MNRYSLIGLSLLGGVLCGLAWTSWCSGLILLVALIPFFIIENHLFNYPKRFSPNAFFIFALPGLVLFSIISVGWMRVASITGAICVILGLSFLMAFMMWLAHMVRLRAGIIAGIISLISFWLCYEFISLNVSIVSPWINLGNGLAKDILFIQWYDVTGTSGGTLWILCSNIILSVFIINYFSRFTYLVLWILVIIIPSFISIYTYKTIEQNNKNGSEVVIIQPNTDPYTEKFTIPFEDQLHNVINQAKPAVTDRTRWVITPETTIDDPANLDDLASDKYIGIIKEFLRSHPKLNMVSGLVTYRNYPPSPEAPTRSAGKTDATGIFYDHFNSAVKIDTGNTFEVYHKSKLVPGIEMQFSEGPGRLLTLILPYLGGSKLGYGTQKDRTCFSHSSDSLKIAPVICYESVFGKFVTGYIKKGAQAIFIITNDGWWKNTSGYKQHLDYASIRAIETRRQVARCGNTGVSCIIDIRGKRLIESPWWQKTVIKGEIFPETRITTYVRYGDYILVIGAIASCLIFILFFIVAPLRARISV